MEHEIHREYRCQPEDIYRLLTDHDFQQRRADYTGDVLIGVEETVRDGEKRMIITREARPQLPRFAVKLLGSLTRVVEDMRWSQTNTGFRNEYDVLIGGGRATVKGHTVLTRGGAGTIHDEHIHAVVHIPVLRRQFERLFKREMDRMLALEATLVATELNL